MWVRMEQRWQLRDMASQNEEQHFRPEEWSRKKKKKSKSRLDLCHIAADETFLNNQL